MINWESDCLSCLEKDEETQRWYQLCFPDEVSEFSLPPPQTHFISALSTDPRTHGLPSVLMGWQTTGLLFTERSEFVSVLLIWWPTQRYFSKASPACINYYYNQENPNQHHFKKPTEAISSSLNSGSACYLTFPHLQSCLHFTSNYFSITSFSIVLPTRAYTREMVMVMLTLLVYLKGEKVYLPCTGSFRMSSHFVCKTNSVGIGHPHFTAEETETRVTRPMFPRWPLFLG